MSTIPKYLIDLTTPTPSGFQKLTACWPHLNCESQLILFDHVKNVTCLQHLRSDFYHFILRETKNDYLNYLAAKELGESATNLVEKHDNPLVRCALVETDGFFIDSDILLKNLLSSPHPARLALLRDLRGHGGTFADFIITLQNTEFNQGSLPENHFAELLTEYLARENFKEFYTRERFDGYAEHLNANDLEKIWSLIPIIPINLSQIIILKTPHYNRRHYCIPEIPPHILRNLNNTQLGWLLQREDVELEKNRKEIFFREDLLKENIQLVYAAVSHNFHLTLEDFGKVLKFPPELKKQALELIASTVSQNFRLVILVALRDLLKDDEDNLYSLDLKNIERSITAKINSLKSCKDSLVSEIFVVKIYSLAKKMDENREEWWTSAWECMLEEIEEDESKKGLIKTYEKRWNGFKTWVNEHIKMKDTWETFLSFYNSSPSKWTFIISNLQLDDCGEVNYKIGDNLNKPDKVNNLAQQLMAINKDICEIAKAAEFSKKIVFALIILSVIILYKLS